VINLTQNSLRNLQVTWIEHTEYDENHIHRLYRPLLRCGLAFGAHRWMAALQRQCECLTILMSSTVSTSTNPSRKLPQTLRFWFIL